VSSEPADPGLVAINAIVFRAAKFTLAETAGSRWPDFGFPSELLQLKLGALLRFILFVGSINEGSILRRSSVRFAPRISQVQWPSAVVRLRCCETGRGLCAKYYAE